MMHATLEELLAMREGEGSRDVAQHIRGCAECAAELERLYQVQARLRSLPVRRPPRDRWSVVHAAAITERRQNRWRQVRRAGVGLAASLALVFGGRIAIRAWLAPPAEPFAADLTTLVEESQQLESTLRSLDMSGRVLNARAAAAIAELEDRIALVDSRLAGRWEDNRRSPEVIDLWRERVGLLDALVTVNLRRAVNMEF